MVPPVETTTTTREVPRGPTAPPLEKAQTRITLSWPNEPNDLDLYVRGYKHGVGPASCLVYYGDKCGCSSVCQDLDNESGGKQIVKNKKNKDILFKCKSELGISKVLTIQGSI